MMIGLLHPGEMGAAVGQCLTAGGHEVLWVPEGRGAATAARAGAAGLTGAGDLADLVRRSDVIMSVFPPHAALGLARQVAGSSQRSAACTWTPTRSRPATAREVAGIIEDGGASYVDGGIIGTPPVQPGFIRFYLSGPRAGEIRDLFDGSPVDARVVDRGTGSGAGGVGAGAIGAGAIGAGAIGSASAVKMAYASWTKGSAALLLTARALARAEGVEDVLLAEWGISQPGLEERSARASASAAAKGWRSDRGDGGDRRDHGRDEQGLPEGFHQAAAEVYRRFSPTERAGDEAGPGAPVRSIDGPFGPKDL